MIQSAVGKEMVAWLLAGWLVALTGLSTGCGSSTGDAKSSAEKPKSNGKKKTQTTPPKVVAKPEQEPRKNPDTPQDKGPPRPLEGPKLAELLNQPGDGGKPVEFDKAAIAVAEAPRIDEEKAAAAGIRKVSGQVLTLYTDLPADKEIDELPAIFEKAVPQWCSYFGLDPGKAANWKPRAYLMKDKERFLTSGLLPADLPPFLNGFQKDNDLWFYEQEFPYYRRHLMLHEGTHGFMNMLLGGAGPPWFMEGTAELLGTHLWKDGALTLGYSPRNKEESAGWGRVKIIKDEFAAGRGMTLQEIFEYGSTAHLKVEPYAWCWGATSFLDRHPLTKQAFRDLRKELRDTSPRFSAVFYTNVKDNWPQITEQWQLFVLEQEYGYDVERAAIEYRPGKPLAADNNNVTIAADRGWQSSGLRLEAGNAYQISAQGQYQIGTQPKIWTCEPGGVTIHYHRGRPLGMLLAAVRPDDWEPKDVTPLARPEPIGLGAKFTPAASGTLYLKINESAADLGDNKGTLVVRVSQE